MATGFPTSTWSVESLTTLINSILGSNDFAAATITTSTIDSSAIGGTVPAAGAFTTLTANNTITLSPASHNVVLSPSGSGLVTINPATAGAMDNVGIGANTADSGAFTTLTANNTVTLSPASHNVVLSPSGSGVVTIHPATAGAMDNVAIGGSTAAAGAFTTVSGSAFSGTYFTATEFFDNSVGTGLSAAGTTRADATALTKAVNNLTTVNASTGVILPPAVTAGVGAIVYVFNAGASAVQVYASGSDTIDGVAGSTGVPLTNAKRCLYIVIAGNTYVSAQLGVVSA